MLNVPPQPDQRVARVEQALRAAGFAGDIEAGFAARHVLATDNSIYQRLPLMAIFPRVAGDIAVAAKVLAEPEFDGLSLTARGGGTGTNGQSLTDSLVLDCSRHLTNILAFDAARGEVTVEPGVVLDQLNAFLDAHGLFFPPNVSTASRATIGGMVATDASGKGSRLYGKTSDYVLGMDVVLASGASHRIAPTLAPPSADEPEFVHLLHAELKAASPAALAHFPKMNRGLTGYNLRDAMPATGGMNLCKLLAGSEGTLALTQSITLRVIAKPKHSVLAVLFYDDFFTALEHVQHLLAFDPLAVEIIDDKVLRLARRDPIWLRLADLFGPLGDDLRAINVVEFVGAEPEQLAERLDAFEQQMAESVHNSSMMVRRVTAPADIKATWALRAKSVGLLGNIASDKSAVAFVEDVAVPPEHLAAFTRAFCTLLDDAGYAYGMYGHADVGCLHVRPIMDMRLPADRAAIRTISDAVAALAKRYGGLLWGEHGRGVRGEYSPMFFGPDLYPVLGRIKAILDPANRLNPGKLAVPTGHAGHIDRIDGLVMRGSLDAQIGAAHSQIYTKAIACNGNGACHSWDVADEMCPSFKATRDKAQSPKGRATLIREWARTASAESEAALMTSLDTCLSCRACAGQCPVKVDIPSMKSRVLESHFRGHQRSWRDRLLLVMEPLLLVARRVPSVANAVLHNPVSKAVSRRVFRLVDLPRFSLTSLEVGMRRADLMFATPSQLAALSPDDRSRAVIIVPDSFLGSFDTAPVFAAAAVLRHLGRLPLIAPVAANGKALEVRGFLPAYHRTKRRLQASLAQLAASGIALVAIEPSTTIQARNDGATALQPIDEFLHSHLAAPDLAPDAAEPLRLLMHCTENALDPAAAGRWTSIFGRIGYAVVPVQAGCCGMSGLFGHEAEHRDLSRRIFDLAWAKQAAQPGTMATGFSCRCQAERFAGTSLRHPVQILADMLAMQQESNAQ